MLFEGKVMAFLSIAISAGILAAQQQAENIHLLSPEEQKFIQNVGHKGKNHACGYRHLLVCLFIFINYYTFNYI